ncbi:MAG: V-type ATP synthase subunit I [Spirochaetaceae bacterium]|jgi:V/A-type H+-transporting ATPase subunit I|nr:V-type ATP synthase subunit I [Spirochaetaceae bacterium]
MIVPMKKVSVVVMDKNKDAALDALRELGIVHLERKTVASPALNGLIERRAQIDAASGALHTFAPKNAPKKGKGVSGAAPSFAGDLVSHVLELSARRKEAEEAALGAEREKQRLEKWGDFNPADFKALAANGVEAYLYDVSLASYENNVGDVPVIVLSSDKKASQARLVAFGKIPNETPFSLPEKSISALNAEIAGRRAEIAKIEAELVSLSSLQPALDREKAEVIANVEFETAKAGMEKADDGAADGETGAANVAVNAAVNAGTDAALSVSWISGYVPASDTGVLKRAASENGWAFCADDPAEDDAEVPTKLKNSKLVSLIYPLTKFLEMSPGYREVDISGWFLLFFTLFFGMIFGDAGYGAILIAVSLTGICKTAKKGTPPALGFFLLMSVSNFLWGLFTCSWFGFDSALVPRFLQNVSLPLIANVSSEPGWLEAYNAGNVWIRAGLIAPQFSAEAQSAAVNRNLMVFCFSIALAQLSIAHIIGVIRNIKSLKFLAEVGQLGMLAGMYCVVLSLVAYNTGFGGVETWQYGALFGGFALVFIFGNYEGNILKSILASLTNIISAVLGIANVFSDIMSYIRLWAVGLAGASISSTVDAFAGPMLGHFLFFIFGIALLVFGHGFNMMLNVLSVLVHGVRLNTLEFSSHLGLTWSGFAYKPFAKR